LENFRESDVVGQACGVIAARLEVEPETAATILARVAQREGLATDELAAEVLASCRAAHVRLPRDLFRNGRGDEPAA
jgi:hypothetical protein